MPRSERQGCALSARRTQPAATADPSSTALLEVQRQLAAVVAALMGVEGTWKTDPSDAPGWWLSTWGRHLAAARLDSPLVTVVLTWLADTQDLMTHGYTLPLDPTLIDRATALREQGTLLATDIQRELADSLDEPT